MTEYKFYSAKYDRAFKEVFLKEKNKDLLKELVEKILDVKISSIKLKSQERLSNNIHISEKRLDALLETDVGKIDIEINSELKDYVHPRNMSYLCNEYASHTLVGGTYDEDTMIIQINLTYGMSKKEKVMREYRIQDRDRKEYVKNFKIIDINMEYYLNMCYDFLKEGKNGKLIEENQILIMLGLNEKELEMLSESYKKVNRYMSEIKEVNKDPEFRRYMTEEEDRQKIFNSEIKWARETGHKEGFEQGKNEGFEQGKNEGIEQGIEKNKIEIAKKMIDKNIDIKTISELINLSVDEINKLR